MKKELTRKRACQYKYLLIIILSVYFLASTFYGTLLAQQKRYLAVVNANLIDGTGRPPINNAVILIENDRFAAVGVKGSVAIPKEATIIDVRGKTVIPGLIDAHIHVTYPPKQDEFLFINEAISAFRAARMLHLMLGIGVTTIRDVSSYHQVGIEAKKAFKEGLFVGARPIVTGMGITSSGGHGTEGLTMGIVEEVDGADGFRRAVRQRLKEGADLIKILPPYSREEVRAAIEETHYHEKFVTVHSGVFKQQYDFVRWAVEEGTDCLEHAYAIPDDLIPQIAAKKIYVVPTISILLRLGEQYKQRGPEWEWKVKKYLECVDIFKKLKAAGVKMAIGTDAVGENMVAYPEIYFEEIENFVKYGYTPLEVITAATKIGAEVCALGEELGTIEKGKIADLVVLAADPLKDIKAIRTAQIIIQNGVVLKSPERPGF
ncbi:MAG: amidohydrolase family protein [Candidatus Aminicenantes bacterium]|nr:amidohydrolase family protein [Candidatus Aminicenantes bacterium]